MPNGLCEREIDAEQVAAEAAVVADVVALLERGALLEQVGDLVDRQQRGDEGRDDHDAGDGDQHDAHALARRARW